MPKPVPWRVLPVLAAAVAVLFAAGSAAAVSPGGAVAASPPGWRITSTLSNLAVGGLWAGGPRDAWLAGDGCADPATCGDGDTSNGTLVVRHWDGRVWGSVAIPRAYVNTPLDQGVGAVAATSAGNLWVFAGRGTQSAEYTDALHRTGSTWAKPVRMNGAVEAAVAASAGQVWAFGSATRGPLPGYYAHFNGRTWKAGGFPVAVTAAAALSPDDVWAGGQAASGALVIDHWDGRSWQAATLVTAGSEPLALSWIAGITAIGPRQVWVSVTESAGAPDGTPLGFLLHWNGTSWTRVSLPFGSDAFIDTPSVSDGHGGLWLAVSTGTGTHLRDWFAHYTDGHWDRTIVPGQAGVEQLVSIPGTPSLWAAGGTADDALDEAILKYGP